MRQIETKYPVTAFAESRIGGRAENQDTCAWAETPLGLLVLVCDGMGGGPAGKLASSLAADTIVGHISESLPNDDRKQALSDAIMSGHYAILNAVAKNPACKGMGTTVTALLINDHSAVVAHAGDSRVYQLHGSHIEFVTWDHSMVMDFVKCGGMTKEEARLAPNSNVITRALGHMQNNLPEVIELAYEKGDRFMLCTDGIWGTMPEKELVKIAGTTKMPAGAVEKLAITADQIGYSEGAHHDNLTVALVETTISSTLKKPSHFQQFLSNIFGSKKSADEPLTVKPVAQPADQSLPDEPVTPPADHPLTDQPATSPADHTDDIEFVIDPTEAESDNNKPEI